MSNDSPARSSRLLPWRGLLWTLLVLAGVVGAAVLLSDRSDPRVTAHTADRTTPPLDSLPPSTLTIPVALDLEPAAARLNDEIPREFGDLDQERTHPSLDNLRYAFEAERTPFQLSLRGDSVRATTTIRYRGRLAYDTPFGRLAEAECGIEGPNSPGARVRLSSPLLLDRNWTLRTNVTLDRVEPLDGGGRCVLSAQGLRIDATEIVLATLRTSLQDQVDILNDAVAQVPVRSQAERAWAALQRPFSLGPDRWLTLALQSVRYTRLDDGSSEPRTLRTLVGLEVTPRLTLGPAPSPDTTSLPPLASRPDNRTTTDDPDSVTVDGRIGYERLARLVEDAIRAEAPDVFGWSIRVDDVALTGLPNGMLVAEVDLTAPAEGTLVLVGSPQIDAEQGELTLPDLDFTMETENLLARIGTWGLRNAFRDQVRQQVRLSIAEALPWTDAPPAFSPLDISFGPAQLEGTLGSMRPQHVGVTDTALVVRMETEVDLRVRSRPEL